MAIIHFPHPSVKNIKRVHRLVVLPDYQGIGIGKLLINNIGDIYNNNGYRYRITTSHPAIINSMKKDKKWKLKRKGRMANSRGGNIKSTSINRLTTSWEYIGY